MKEGAFQYFIPNPNIAAGVACIKLDMKGKIRLFTLIEIEWYEKFELMTSV